MLNETHDPDTDRLVCSYPAVPIGGGVVIYGDLVGIAESNEDSEGYTVVRLGGWHGTQSVVASNGAITAGDPLFASQATPVVLSNSPAGCFFGWAKAAIASGTSTIEVIKASYAGGILGSGSVITADLAAHSITAAKMVWPIDPSAETPGTTTTGTVIKIGATGLPYALNTANQVGEDSFYSTTATTGTTYGRYVRLDAGGAGVEAIAGRSKTLVTANSVGNAHGHHATLELDTSLGSVTGLATGLRANLVLPARAIAGGTYYGAMAEIYCPASSDISAVTEHACLAVQANGDNTAKAKVLNAISFTGADATGKMIYTATDSSVTHTGSIRILVNGAVRYLHFASTQAAGS